MIRHIDLDQARGLIHYPYNCGRCLSDRDLCRGIVTGIYLCICTNDLYKGDREAYEGSTVRVNGRTYPVGVFVKMIEPSLPKEGI